MLPAHSTPSGALAGTGSHLRLVQPDSVQGRVRLAARVTAVDGRFLTSGVAEISGDAATWRATLTRLDRPGIVAALFFTEGLRDIVLRLADGRAARGRITGTSFVAATERVCTLEGTEPLA